MEKEVIEVNIDFLMRPVFWSDGDTGELHTGIDVIDNNEKIKKLNIQIGDMYDGYYEFDSHDQACWFDEERFKKERPLLLSLVKELVEELNKINDGSYEVVDKATKYLKKICKK